MKTKELPLTIGDKVVGTVTLDYADGKMEGHIDGELIAILDEAMGAGLMEIAFIGTPSFPEDPASVQKKLYDYLNDGK